MVFHGIETEEQARAIGDRLHECLSYISQDLDLERFDGVTVSHFYAKSLAELDRGLGGARTLSSVDGPGTNELASAPPVKRDGMIKSHLVLDAGILHNLSKPESDSCRYVIHIIAYQCAHIHGLKYIDLAFPGTLLQGLYKSYGEFLLDQITWTCWGAYTASRLSALYASSEVLDDHERAFISLLEETRPAISASIEEYRVHGDVERLCKVVSDQCEALFKHAGIFLGDLHGGARQIERRSNAYETIDGHWFQPHFENLDKALSGLTDRYGRWIERTEFDVITDIARDMLADVDFTWFRDEAGEWRVSLLSHAAL